MGRLICIALFVCIQCFAQQHYIVIRDGKSCVPIERCLSEKLYSELEESALTNLFRFSTNNIIEIIYGGNERAFSIGVFADAEISQAHRQELETKIGTYVRWRRMGFSRIWCEESMRNLNGKDNASRPDIPSNDALAIGKAMNVPLGRIEPLAKLSSASIIFLASGRSYLIRDTSIYYLINIQDTQNPKEPLCSYYALDAGELSATWAGTLRLQANKLKKEILAGKHGAAQDARTLFNILKQRAKKTIPDWRSPCELDPKFGW